LNVIFVCRLARPAQRKNYGAIERPSRFAASVEAMCQQGIDAFAKLFSYDVVETIRLFQDY
jgi:hypothetical protein